MQKTLILLGFKHLNTRCKLLPFDFGKVSPDLSCLSSRLPLIGKTAVHYILTSGPTTKANRWERTQTTKFLLQDLCKEVSSVHCNELLLIMCQGFRHTLTYSNVTCLITDTASTILTSLVWLESDTTILQQTTLTSRLL